MRTCTVKSVGQTGQCGERGEMSGRFGRLASTARGSQDGSDRVREGSSVADDDASKPSRNSFTNHIRHQDPWMRGHLSRLRSPESTPWGDPQCPRGVRLVLEPGVI
jgi:hypothetical protein